MQFLHISNTLIIALDGENYTIDSTDIRYEKLVQILNTETYSAEDVKNVLTLKFSSKIKHAAIKDGQFVINDQLVPEPFSSFLLKFKDQVDLFEFYYNFYFSLSKRQDLTELETWRSLINENRLMVPFSCKEEQILVLYSSAIKSKYFLSVNSFVTEEKLQNFVKRFFKKNLYKSLKDFVFAQDYINWEVLSASLSFFSHFKENEDKFFSEISGIKNISTGYQYLSQNQHRQELINTLNQLQITTLSQLKRFFGGLENSLTNLNQLHILAREIAPFNELYTHEIFFQNYEKLTFETFSQVVTTKLVEWKKRYGEISTYSYFKLDQRHPWLLDLKKFEIPELGECFFILPNRGLDLDVWSNTMNHCIRTYKEQQIQSNSMVLLSIINKDRVMIATLELNIDYLRNDLKIRQFVGFANEQIQHMNPLLFEAGATALKRAFYPHCQKLDITGSI